MEERRPRHEAQAGDTILVNAFRCRMWALQERLDDYVTEESCKAEIESFALHGQLIPALGRRVHGEPEYDFELIYGARRLFVARHLNQPLAIRLRDISDRDALIAMDIENRHRVDISPYERALSYARWLRAGHFQSQDEIARAIQVSASQVSRLLKLARLPSVIVAAFARPLDILEGWGLDLANAWEDPQRRKALAARARQVAALNPRPPARDIYEGLISTIGLPRRARSLRHDEVILSARGKPLFRVRRQHKSISLSFPVEKLSVRALEKIKSSVTEILETEFPSRADAPLLSSRGEGEISPPRGVDTAMGVIRYAHNSEHA